MRMNASTFVCPIHALDKAIRRLTRQTKDEEMANAQSEEGKLAYWTIKNRYSKQVWSNTASDTGMEERLNTTRNEGAALGEKRDSDDDDSKPSKRRFLDALSSSTGFGTHDSPPSKNGGSKWRRAQRLPLFFTTHSDNGAGNVVH